MLTEVKEVFIEEQTYAGSAFGVTAEGDGVFFNSRIVEAVKLQGGQTVKAYLVPNFPDKRDSIPWRAMRVEVLKQETEMVARQAAPLIDRLHELLTEEGGGLTALEAANELGEDVEVVRKLLEGDNQIHKDTIYYV